MSEPLATLRACISAARLPQPHEMELVATRILAEAFGNEASHHRREALALAKAALEGHRP